MVDQIAITMANAELYEHARTLAALQERQRLAQNLHDAVNQSLLSAGLVAAFTGWSNIPVAVAITGEHDLAGEIQVALYRICQEALNNIAKHAEASRVEIDLQYDADTAQVSPSLADVGIPQEIVVNSVEMRIRDNGHGLDSRLPAVAGRYGQGMMRECAESVGAELTVTSRPDHGTEVTLHWPESPKQET